MRPSSFLRSYGVHIVFIVLCIVAIAWIFQGMSGDETNQKEQEVGIELVEKSTLDPVASRDEAVAKYLDAAQILAEIYRFSNNGSYAGLCEKSEDFYTLEGESGGILKYIKFVGATEVYCATSDGAYLIEAKMPENGRFYCIDHSGNAVAQQESKVDSWSCQ